MERKHAWSITFTLLFALLIAFPVSCLLSALFPITGRITLSVSVEAKRVENAVIFIVRHTGGGCLYFDLAKNPDKLMEGEVLFSDGSKMKIVNWTFERPDRFCEGDLAWAKADISENLREDIFVKIWIDGVGTVFSGFVTIK
ncbi:MAG: hypothetical protein QXX33_04315 [Candidatus Hadarchaeales archaeon]